MNWELKKIQKELLKLPEEERERLRGQECAFLTCPLRDVENKKCVVYNARPSICRMQGTYEGLSCPHNKEVKLKSRQKGHKKLQQYFKKGEYCVGILGITLSFEDIENWEEGVEMCRAEPMKII
jgi:Fe-S-cluster containining protein